jgi:acyl-CoA synthetase (AMP-forming)/AMP-acid ligase II
VATLLHASRKLGMVAVPVAYRFTPAEMRFIVEDSGAALVLVDAEQAPTMAEAVAGLDTVREVVVFRGAHDGMRSWDEVVGAGSDAPPPPLPDAGFGQTMIYTSGTTGRPKGALRRRTDAGTVLAMVVELGLSADDVHLTTGPLYHSGPLAFATITHTLGGTIVVARTFDAREWLRLVERHRVTTTFSAPTQLKRIVSLPGDVLAAADLSSMRVLIANAAPVPYSLKQEWVEKLGADRYLFEIYGSTELGVDTILRPEDQLRKPGSCGRPYGGIEVKVVDDEGEALPPGQPGELYIRSPLAIEGYHGGREIAALPDDEGWKSVGDVAYLDEEGFVHICDRKADMVITGGMNVYPAEVESVLHAHPDVADVAVFGVPSDEWGEQVHAVVQPRPGATPDLDAVAAWAAERLASYKRPRSWELRDALPRTESGKLLKRVLREEHWKGRDTRV